MSIYTKEKGYNFRVIYDIKHVKKTSTLYGVLTEQSVSFPTLQSAIKFARDMNGKKTTKFEVVGMPIIERLAS
jgi:hypothetical protein